MIRSRSLRVLTFTFGLLSVHPLGAYAHTQPDFVAIPAGGEATLTLRPTHGCAGSPTVMVAVRAPVEGALPGDVQGWTSTAEADGSGNTVLTWSGGLLPADQEGAFPVIFSVPDMVGELLLFPAIQTCQNGEELAWISGDPESDYPAPRVLVLSPGSAPAATIDDVPQDAAGRDQLLAIVDTDNPTASTTTSSTLPDTTSSSAPTTTDSSPAAPATTAIESAPGHKGDRSGPWTWVVVVLAATVALGLGWGAVRRTRSRAG